MTDKETNKETSSDNSSEGAVLSKLWKTILSENNLNGKIKSLITVYVDRHDPGGQALSTKKMNKSSITKAITSDSMTWKVFLSLIFNVLLVKRLDITVTLHHANGTKWTHSTSVKK